MRRLLSLLAFLVAASPVAAQQVVTSSGPEKVSVTVYRAPGSGEGREVNLRFLQGYALVTETREINVPAGESQIRFEGVAEGIIPVSAIVTGLPGGVVQKNRDANLLSPASLLDGSLGNRVLVRRTNKKTGKVEEQEAILRTGADQGVILETKDGIEALNCSGNKERVAFNKMPGGLTAKPTLSIITRSKRGGSAKVTLSYLSRNFDWAANYVAEVDAEKKTLNLFAWLTLANGNGESFAKADTNAVAGNVNRDRRARIMEQVARSPRVSVRCWPMDITSTHPRRDWEREEMDSYSDKEIMVTGMAMPVYAPPPAPVMEMSAPMSARKAMVAKQEELGDLKLYRIPEPVTVAARAQKQVALLEKKAVPFDRIYTAQTWAYSTQFPSVQMNQILRMKNIDKKGLGLPLPSGSIAIFEPLGDRNILVGRAPVRDSAIGEKVEVRIGQTPQVHWTLLRPDDYALEVTNANPYPIKVEFKLQVDAGGRVVNPSEKLVIEDGMPMWQVTVAANSASKLTYGIKTQLTPPLPPMLPKPKPKPSSGAKKK